MLQGARFILITSSFSMENFLYTLQIIFVNELLAKVFPAALLYTYSPSSPLSLSFKKPIEMTWTIYSDTTHTTHLVSLSTLSWITFTTILRRDIIYTRKEILETFRNSLKPRGNKLSGSSARICSNFSVHFCVIGTYTFYYDDYYYYYYYCCFQHARKGWLEGDF